MNHTKLLGSITSKHTDEDKQKLQEIADTLDMSLSEYVRTITKNAVNQYERYGVFQPRLSQITRDTVDTSKDTEDKVVTTVETTEKKVSLFSFLGIEIVVDVKKAQQFAPVELFQSAFQRNTKMSNQILPQRVVKTNTAVQV